MNHEPFWLRPLFGALEVRLLAGSTQEPISLSFQAQQEGTGWLVLVYPHRNVLVNQPAGEVIAARPPPLEIKLLDLFQTLDSVDRCSLHYQADPVLQDPQKQRPARLELAGRYQGVKLCIAILPGPPVEDDEPGLVVALSPTENGLAYTSRPFDAEQDYRLLFDGPCPGCGCP